MDRALPALSFALGILSCLARSPTEVLHPEIYAEDGRFWFADAYNRGWLRPLTEPHTGYLQTFPRLVASVGLHVSLLSLPALFVDVALAVQVLPVAFVVSRRMVGLVPRRGVRILLGVIYLALPNSHEVNVNLTNAQWHLALLALLVVLAVPARGPWEIFDVLVVALSGLTGPFTIALVVVAGLMYLVRRGRWRRVLLIESTVLAVLQLGELLSSPRGVYGPLGITWDRLVEILGDEIAGGTFLGEARQLAILRGDHDLVWSALLLLGGVALTTVAVVLGPLELRLFNGYTALLLGASLLDPVVSVRRLQWQALVFDPQMRYWFFPTLALLVDALFLVTCSGCRAGMASVAGVALLVVAAGLAVPQDWRFGPLTPVAWAAQVRAFEVAPKGRIFVFHIAPGDWTMTLVKR